MTSLASIEAVLQGWLRRPERQPSIVEVQQVLCALSGASPVLRVRDALLLDDMARSEDIDTDLWARVCAIAWLQLLTPARLVTGWGLVAEICPWLGEFTVEFEVLLGASALATQDRYAVIDMLPDHYLAVLGGLAVAVATHCTNTSLADAAQLLVLVNQVELRATARVCATMAMDDDFTDIHATLTAGRYWALLGFCIAICRAIRDNDTRRLPTVQAA